MKMCRVPILRAAELRSAASRSYGLRSVDVSRPILNGCDVYLLSSRLRVLERSYSNIYHEIRDEAHDLPRREAALKAKETQKIQKEVIAVKSQLEKIVEDFEAKITTEPNALVKESESAISSSSITEADRSSLRVKLGDQVLQKKKKWQQ